MTDETLFAAALEKADPAARAAFLDDACRDDPDLRRRMDGLLAAHDKAGSFLNRPAVEPPDPGTAATRAFGEAAESDSTRTFGADADPAPDDEALGFLTPPTRPDALGRIGHYEVLEVLGRGGFGIVFRAFDEVLQRVVAVKVLAPQMAATSPARKRFLREARSAAAVQHENVVRIHETGEHPLPYLVMEFIPGETLQQRLDRTGPLDLAEILRVGRQVAEGLAAAHAQGLVHRDIKPANVLIEGGPQHRAKLTDFGLARAADDASISQSGVVAGTPMYMAPEQAKGETLDHRADLFSLGSVLYVMCTGRPPFRATTTFAVLKRVAEDHPRPIREVIPEVPEWLCRVVEKLHAKDPAARFQSAREVADVLADCEAQLKAHAGLKDFSRIPGGKPAPRRKWRRVATVGALLLIALAGVGVYALTRPDPDRTNGGRAAADGREIAGWGTAVDPAGDCRFVEENGRLTITVPGGGKHDLNPLPGRNNLDAPRVVREVDGDFESQVTVLPYPTSDPRVTAHKNPPYIPYVAAGLFVMQDDTHILRYCRAKLDNPYIHAHWFNGPIDSGELTSPFHGGPLHLRIRRVAGVIFVAHSTNGQDWSDESATDFPTSGRVRVGVVVVSSVDQDYPAQFENFKLKELPPAHDSDGLPLAAGPTDLIPLARPDLSQGRWEARDGKLVHPRRGGAEYPVLPLAARAPDEYDLEAEFERTEGPDFIAFGMSAYGHQFQVALDTWGKWAGVQSVDGKLLDQNPTRRAGPWLTNGRRHALRCEVRAAGIRAWLDGREVVDYRGGYAALSARPPGTPDWVRFYVQAIDDCGFVVHKLVLTPRASAPASDGFVALFNGKDLSGWKTLPVQPGEWKVQGGVLTGTGEETSHLFTERGDYANYHLRAEVRVNEDGDGGVFFRVPALDLPRWGTYPRGFVAKVDATATGDDDEPTGSLTLALTRDKFAETITSKKPPPKPGEWFTLEILATRGAIAVKVNGATTAELNQAEPEFARGHIALQVRDPGTVIEFRKIEVKELPPPSIAGLIDLIPLARIDPGLGTWKRDGDTLVCSPRPNGERTFQILPIPVALPAEYEVEAVFERVAGDDTIGFNLTGGGAAFAVVVDSWPTKGSWSGLSKIDGKEPHENGAGVRGPRIVNGTRHTFRCAVRATGVAATLDGKPIAEYAGPLARLEGDFLAYAGTKCYVKVLGTDGYRIHSLRLTPLAPQAGASQPPPDPAVVQPLRDAVAAKQRSLDVMTAKLEVGAASKYDRTLAAIDLTEARIKLAQAERDTGAVRAVLHELVTLRQEEHAFVTVLVKEGKEPPDALNQADARLAAAKARLAQAHAAAPPPAVAPFDAATAELHQKVWARHLGVPIEYANGIGMKLRLIPPGEFTMGSSPAEVERLVATEYKTAPEWLQNAVRDEAPERRVNVPEPFYLGAHEVTVGQFREFVTATGFKTWAEKNGGGFVWDDGAGKWSQTPANVWSSPKISPSEAHPAVFVTVDDAQAFCAWLSEKDGRRYAVPTEEQWEHACRAGTATRWFFGDDRARMKEFGWTLPHSGGSNRPVGRLLPNPFGLYDVYGNVLEVAISPKDQAFNRGGEVGAPAWQARSASRIEILMTQEANYRRGFRVAVVGDLTAKPAAREVAPAPRPKP